MKLKGFWTKSGKYRNKKVQLGDLKFDSILEADVYLKLNALLHMGEIKSIECQPKVKLSGAQILFKPDFKCVSDKDEVFFVEAKGYETAMYRLKRRLWEHYGPAALQIYVRGPRGLVLKETIWPKK
jgi:hypothetical protein